MYFLMVGERILLTLWAGSLWAIGYIAAPTLFAMLDDRKLAGSLAGQMFHIVSYIGLICGILLFVSLAKRLGMDWRIWVIATMVALVACGEFILQPMMESLKIQGLVEGGAIRKQFGMLHGIASIIYLIESLLALSLIVFGLQKTEQNN
ncbi:MAG: DUF4149 domain-containing protein [Gammaproteobacteria bacterium]|jgi:hypothetical protein